ncbi:MAG: T9SS type A sorting domain-containing protein [Bacteroidales bacterium]|nr:T9SS type A sorting domain-containing protein [Bacteroidales bacterium]
MKRSLLLSLAILFAMTTVAQKPQLKMGIPTASRVTGQKVAIEPLNPSGAFAVKPKPISLKYVKGTKDFVDVVTLGTSANAYGYGYAGGQKTMVWADDNLNAIINIHRMGPGSTPPSLSGYLAVDLGINNGLTADDWTKNYQVYAAKLVAATYLDAARYPQGAIYNPEGNTELANAYCAYITPNLSATTVTWGGYSYGTCNLVDQTDSVKKMRWYSPPPYTYIPDGFTVTKNGIAFYTDLDQNWTSGSVVYQGKVILGRGIWNANTHAFDYTISTLPLTTTENNRPANERIAASPDGERVWIVALANNGGATQIGDFANYYPILFKSTDAGQTWSDPIVVQLDGPNGIEGVKNYLSDYMITQLFDPPYPTRDQIGYTTAFDCDISVDKWGNPHIGVAVGVTPSDYSIASSDSAFCIFDIYSTDQGATWSGVAMGFPWTFRGNYPDDDYTEDNRVNISSTQTGDKIFVTWNDTQISGFDDNTMPDVFARGFDLITNKITAVDGVNEPDNVTLLSEVSSSAWFQCMSHYVFTDDNKFTLPIVTQYMDATDPAQPVEFKYLTNFSYVNSDFSIPVPNPVFPVGIETKTTEVNTLTVSPNPVKDFAMLNLNLSRSAKVSLTVSNLVGQQVMSFDKGQVTAGAKQFTLDANNLPSGIYMVTALIDGQKLTKKMIVQ